MKILCVDTTSDNLTVAVIHNDRIFTVINEEGRGTTSANIIGCIDRALNSAGIKINELDYIGAVVGPGSFTGIRIGISVVNAFHLALKIPLISATTFEALSKDALGKSLCVVDARHNCFYGAVFYDKNNKLNGQREYTLAEAEAFDGKIIARGNYKNIEKLDKVTVIDDKAYSAKLAAVITDKAQNNETVPYLIPLYMKLSQAERNKKE